MAGLFSREVWNPRERPYSSDNNREAAYVELALRAAIAAFTTPRTSAANPSAQTPVPTGFIGEAFKCYAPPVDTPYILAIAPGIGFVGGAADAASSIGGVIGVDDTDTFKPLVLSRPEFIQIVNNPTTLNRIDLIEVRYRRELVTPSPMQTLDTDTGIFVPDAVRKSLTWDCAGQQGTVVSPAPSTACIGYKVGIPAVSPTYPAVTPGYIPLAWFRILPGQPGFTDPQQITEERRLLAPYGVYTIAMTISVDSTVPGAPGVTLVEFGAPPGVEVPTFTHAEPSATSREVTCVLRSLPLGVTTNANRFTSNVQVLSTTTTAFPVVVGRTITVGAVTPPSVDAIITLNFQALILTTAGLSLTTALGVFGNPTVYRITITYW